jgi:hypothetical protein
VAASGYVRIRRLTSTYVIIRQHTSAYVSIRQHTSAYVSIRMTTPPTTTSHLHKPRLPTLYSEPGGGNNRGPGTSRFCSTSVPLIRGFLVL